MSDSGVFHDEIQTQQAELDRARAEAARQEGNR